MIASVYIKDGNIHFYNEKSGLSGIGGIAYEMGRPLLDFVCYEPERFGESFSVIASAFDNEFAHVGAREPEFIAELNRFRLIPLELFPDNADKHIFGDFFDVPNIQFINSCGNAIISEESVISSRI